jgi:hypothetical protein
MEDGRRWEAWVWWLIVLVVLAAIGLVALLMADNNPRGGGLRAALDLVGKGDDKELALVAKALLSNYVETRTNAKNWSGIYWGFTFGAAALSALAGLVLKIDALIRDEGWKKDVAAICAVSAALLITISTSGDFQRKWQANRVAAAELERAGYAFLATGRGVAGTYLKTIGDIQHRRHLSIIGIGEDEKKKPAARGPSETDSGKGVGPNK